MITEVPSGAGGEKPPCLMGISLYPQTEVEDKGIQLHGGAFIFKTYSGDIKKKKNRQLLLAKAKLSLVLLQTPQ